MRVFLACLLCALLAGPLSAMEFSKSPRHYAVEMENYYVKPRAEMLAPMLEAFGRAGVLDNAGKRMSMAAFLAELLKNGQARPDMLLKNSARLSAGAKAALAWAMYLAGKTQQAQALLAGGQKLLLEQMRGMPSDLAKWDPSWEKTVIDMYWGAFMATGNAKWLDGIIGAALLYARNGRSEPGRHAAATLYEYAPRHARVSERVRERLKRASPAEKGVLETILAREGQKED